MPLRPVLSPSGEGLPSSTTLPQPNAFGWFQFNFGVTFSCSTFDYMVDANELLQLAGTSQLQTIGTSSRLNRLHRKPLRQQPMLLNKRLMKPGETWSDYVALNGGNDAEITAAAGGGSPSTVANGSFSGDITTETAFNAERNKQINELTKSTFASTVESANSSSSSGQN